MTGRQRRAISALLEARNTQEAAQKAGVGYSTLRSWLKNDPEFATEYREAQDEITKWAATRAKQSIGPALDALRTVMENPQGNPAAAVGAARTVLEYSLRLSERADVLDRLEKLEVAVHDDC